MRKILLMGFLGLFSGGAGASNPTGSLIEPTPATAVVNEVIKLIPVADHHFNLKAPQKCAGQPMSSATQMEMTCQISKSGKQTIEVSVCDDPESFCKTESHTVNVTAPKGYKPNQLEKGEPVYIPRGERPVSKGWMLNRPEQAIQSAKNRKTLLMIDFFGHWCPPCNLFDETVFGDKDFPKNTSDIVKVKLDVDSDISWKLKDFYKVGGYPTIVMVDHNLNEIGRIVGYRPKAAFMKWVDQMRALKDQPIEAALKLRNQEGVSEEKIREITLRAAEYYLEREAYPEALVEAKKLAGEKGELLAAKASLAIAQKNKDDKATAVILESLLNKNISDFSAASWVQELHGIDAAKAKPFLEKALLEIEKWKTKPELDEQGYTKGDVHFFEAKLRELNGQEDLAKIAYLGCAEAYGELAKQSDLDLPRGANQERAYCLMKGGNKSESLDLYRKLALKYKGEFAFNYYYASALLNENDLTNAATFARLAVNNSYGDNWLRAVTLQAKIEVKQGKIKDAEKTVANALARAVMPASTQIRSHRYLTALKNVVKDNLEKDGK